MAAGLITACLQSHPPKPSTLYTPAPPTLPDPIQPVMGDLGLALVKAAKYDDEEGSRCGAYSELGVGARQAAADARRAGLAAVRHSRLARVANAQAMEALEPLHDELAMSPVRVRSAADRDGRTESRWYGRVLGVLEPPHDEPAHHEPCARAALWGLSCRGSGGAVVGSCVHDCLCAHVKPTHISPSCTPSRLPRYRTQAVVAALREREAALLTVQSIEEDLEKRCRAAAALEESGARRCGRGRGGVRCVAGYDVAMSWAGVGCWGFQRSEHRTSWSTKQHRPAAVIRCLAGWAAMQPSSARRRSFRTMWRRWRRRWRRPSASTSACASATCRCGSRGEAAVRQLGWCVAVLAWGIMSRR